jgi:hypothetical protein
MQAFQAVGKTPLELLFTIYLYKILPIVLPWHNLTLITLFSEKMLKFSFILCIYIAGTWFPEFHPVFLFSLSGRLHCCCYIDFHCSYLYNYYNSSRSLLCIKCWDSAFRIEFQHFVLRFSIPYWVSAFSYWDSAFRIEFQHFRTEFQHFILRLNKISLLCGYHH